MLLLLETAALLLTSYVAWYYNKHLGEQDLNSFLVSAAVTGTVGLMLYFFGRKRKKMFDADDTFVIVSLSWLLFSAFGMLPSF